MAETRMFKFVGSDATVADRTVWFRMFKIAAGLFLFLGAVPAYAHPADQAWHDAVADTVRAMLFMFGLSILVGAITFGLIRFAVARDKRRTSSGIVAKLAAAPIMVSLIAAICFFAALFAVSISSMTSPVVIVNSGTAGGEEEPHDHDDNGAHGTSLNDEPAMPGARPPDSERQLFLTAGGIYSEADIRANGSVTPSEKYAGFRSVHNMQPKKGQRICPITNTLANPKLGWIVGGKRYTFCCPPCLEEFVARAKDQPKAILRPEQYVKH